MRIRHLITGLATTLTLAACADRTVAVGSLEEITSLRAIPNRSLDILFVIDNSRSMYDKQTALVMNFPKMMAVLEQLDGGLPDLHIGVITSDMGTSGSGSQTPGSPITGCTGFGDDGVLRTTASVSGTFISDIAAPEGTGGIRVRNYTGSLATVFSELALVGESGCAIEQHLASLRRSLQQPANTGFLRPDANLAVIIIADEDDCSILDPAILGPDSAALGILDSYRCTQFGITCDQDVATIGAKTNCGPRANSPWIEDVQPFVDALIAVKGDPRKVMVAGIVGDPGPVAIELATIFDPPAISLASTCTYAGPTVPQVAHPAVRISAFLDAFPGRSQLTSICSADLSAPLAAIGDTTKKLVGDPCLDSAFLADTSLEPGLQPACEVVDIRDSVPDSPAILPTCASGSATDCYDIIADPTMCPSVPDHLRVRFRRTSVAADTWTHVRCQLRP